MISVPIGALRPYALGNALGFVAIFSLVMYAILSWFAGFTPAIITDQYPLPFNFDDWTILMGLVQAYVLGYVGGWIIAYLYNRSLLTPE